MKPFEIEYSLETSNILESMVAKPEFWVLQNASEAQAQRDTHVEWVYVPLPRLSVNLPACKVQEKCPDTGQETASLFLF